MAIYSTLAACLTDAVASRRTKMRPFGLRELLYFSLAIRHLSQLNTKDPITAIIRKPITEFESSTGEVELIEKFAGTGIRRAAGELLNCPFCLGQRIATGLVAGRLLFPEFTESVAAISVIARLSDYLQIAHCAFINYFVASTRPSRARYRRLDLSSGDVRVSN